MMQWILSKPDEATVFKRAGDSTAQKEKAKGEMCFVPETRYYVYNNDGDLLWVIVVGHYDPCGAAIPDDDDTIGGEDGGVPCAEQLLPPPECSDGGGDECPPPYYCDGGGGGGLPPLLNPCDTNGEHPVLDNVAVQQAMDDAWAGSYGSDGSPLPDDQRSEAMFMVLATMDGYEIEEIPPGPETSSCHFDGGEFSVPSNIVALIHTHPYSDGDTINDPRCGSGFYDGDDVSSGDESLMRTIGNSTILPPIPMYIIDKNKIRIIQPSNPSQYSETINRCGY